ncbi:MAG: phosphate/phosphite/phosphonate ABC transporter substrate-binding protein [Pseudobdellovibrio sp.]
MKLLILLLLSAIITATAQSETTYRFGIVPQQNLSVMTKLWPKIMSQIETRSGVRLEYKSNVDITSFEKATKAGDYDFAYMNPYHYAVMFKDSYYAIARENIKLAGIVVVSKKSSYKELKDLKGARFTFPSPLAYAATVLMKEELKSVGIDPEKDIKTQYSGDHDKGYTSVVRGYADAAGGVTRTFAQLKPELASELRVLYKTAEVVPHPFVANNRIPKDVSAKVAAALIATCSSSEGKPLCEELGMKEIILAGDPEWQSLRDRYIKKP